MMLGDAQAIKYARRDLETLDRAVTLAPGRRSVVQAGGSLGVFAMELADAFAAVYCYEPHPSTFRKLVHNVRHYDNVVCVQGALGYERGKVQTAKKRRRKVHLPPHDGITHVVPEEQGLIPTFRVDDLGLDDLDLLVLDTEGYEFFALKGADETIRRCRPAIMIEINENCQFYGLEQEWVRGLLRGFGYEFQFRLFSDEVWKCRR